MPYGLILAAQSLDKLGDYFYQQMGLSAINLTIIFRSAFKLLYQSLGIIQYIIFLQCYGLEETFRSKPCQCWGLPTKNNDLSLLGAKLFIAPELMQRYG
jgi:hypothetical protein